MAIWWKLILASIKDDILSKKALVTEWRAETLGKILLIKTPHSSHPVLSNFSWEMSFCDAFYTFYSNFFTYDNNLCKICNSQHFISNMYTYSPQQLGVN